MPDMTLRCGAVVAVDDDVLLAQCRFAWFLDKDGYVSRKTTVNGKKGRMVRLHRVVTGADVGQLVDHIDGNRLNNKRANLRLATKAENGFNSLKRPGTASQHKGVTWNKGASKWQAQIKINGKQTYLGSFDEEDEAAHAYNKMAVIHFGEFACLNPIGKDKFSQEAASAKSGEKATPKTKKENE